MDGSETEVAAVKDIMALMDKYFVEEVLVKPEYAPARGRWYVSLVSLSHYA